MAGINKPVKEIWYIFTDGTSQKMTVEEYKKALEKTIKANLALIRNGRKH